MQAGKKVLEGYIEYFEKRHDPKLRDALEKYGLSAVYLAFKTWTENQDIEGVLDPSDVPVDEIIRTLSKENKYLQLAHP